MTDIIIKRYRPEEFPRHLDFLERMTVTKGTVEAVSYTHLTLPTIA